MLKAIVNSSTGATGDVVGPSSSTDNAVVRFDGTTGKLIQNSGVLLDDNNSISGVNALSIVSLTIGSITGVLSASSGVVSAGTIPFSSVTGTVPVNQGGTGQTTYTNGQLLIGNTTGNTLTTSTLTAGSGVSITNGTGSITLAIDPTAAVTSVSGTTNRITVSPNVGATVVDISASYVGQASITTLGTITTGGWNAAGSVRLNGGNTTGFENLANANTSRFGAVLTSNTSGHHALFVAEVAGNSSGSDPFINFKNSNAGTDWAVGSDTSDSAAWKLSQGSTIGTNDTIKVTTAGAVTILRGDMDVRRSSSGGDVGLAVINSSNTASSSSTFTIGVGGSSSGDAAIIYDNSGTNDWIQGLDNSDSDAFVLASSAALGSTNVMRFTTGGVQNLPLQPVFNAWKTGGAGNITGNGAFTTFLVDAQNQQNNCYTGNQTYTAKTTGYHLLIASVQFTNLSASFTHGEVRIVTTSTIYTVAACNIGAIRDASNTAVLGGSVIAKMTAGDTAVSQMMASGGTLTVGVGGAAAPITMFMGCQLC